MDGYVIRGDQRGTDLVAHAAQEACAGFMVVSVRQLPKGTAENAVNLPRRGVSICCRVHALAGNICIAHGEKTTDATTFRGVCVGLSLTDISPSSRERPPPFNSGEENSH